MENFGVVKDGTVSGGPRGLKREYAFVSSQAKLTTPARRPRASVEGNGHPENDVTVEPKTETPNNISQLKKPSLKLKDLMKSGLLEGLLVRYIRGPKMKGPTVFLKGFISGAGIFCSCDLCEGKKVVSPNKFEVHAGSGNKRPAEYIYLENGKNLRDVLNVCKDTPLEGLVLAVQNFISCASPAILEEPISKDPVCASPAIFEEPISKDPVCASPAILEDPANVPSRILKESENDYSPATLGENSKPNSPGILVNSEPSVGITTGSEKETSLQAALPPNLSVNKSSESKPQGRLTKKDNRMHKLVFDAIEDGTPVEYMARKEVVKSGIKMGMRIKCSCCSVKMSPSQFEAHAGWGSRRKPYLHTFVEGSSLHELAVQLSRTAKISDDIKDTLCSNCEEGDVKGELKSCDSCPRVFHTACIPDDPKTDYHCRYCRNNFQTEKNATRVRGRVPKADDDGGCTLCGCHDFNIDGPFGPRTVMVCDQCEREYHVSCLKKHKRDDLKELPEGEWLCCTECELIHNDLQHRLASGEVGLTESSMSHIKRKMEENGSATDAELDIKWRLFRGKMVPKDTNTMLSQAESLFHNRFQPILEPHPKLPGTVDLIPGMVYGKLDDGDLGELGGMYCGILSVNSIVACAGVFRIFGSEVAELPLVATNIGFERLGYFQALFSCIENILTALSVKDLVLPAANDAKSMWTNKFGFVEMSDDEMKRYRKRYPMMAFHGTTTLHKPIKKDNVV